MSEEKKIQTESFSDLEKKNGEDFKLEMQKRFAELAKNSLVRVQYSCSGNSCGIDVDDFDIENH